MPAAIVRESRVDGGGDARVGVASEERRLGERGAGGERERDERVPEVVKSDTLAAVTVQPGRVPGGVNGSERVAGRLRPAARCREDEASR